MFQSREEKIQLIFEKFENIFKTIHKRRFHLHKNKQRFPFEDLNLSRREIIFLFIIGKSQDGISVKDLSKFQRITSGAVTQFIDSLIEKNLVKREEDTYDRRVIKIKLTDYAKSKFNNFKKGYVESLVPFFDNLTDEELDQFINILEKLRSNTATAED